MAKAIDQSSGVLAIASVAESSMSLYDTVQSFQSNPKQLRDLSEELKALNGTLASLHDVLRITPDINLTVLELPLKLCGDRCKDLQMEILKCSSRSRGNRTSFRDWVMLRYMVRGVEGVRQLLLRYISTFDIFLADVNLRKLSATKQTLESYKKLINTDHLESYFQKLDEKLQVLSKSTAKGSVASTEEPHNEGKREHRDRMGLTATQLLGHIRELSDCLEAKTMQGAVSEEFASSARLREECEAISQCMDACIKAGKHLEAKLSATEANQLSVSATSEILRPRGRNLGLQSQQIVGHLSDDTVRSL
ncbi:hypothetical protein B0T10DRAFT_436508, partial [Thelonectria olida]